MAKDEGWLKYFHAWHLVLVAIISYCYTWMYYYPQLPLTINMFMSLIELMCTVYALELVWKIFEMIQESG